MKTLGLVYSRLGQGGIERGASFQIPFFCSLGWKVVVFTSYPLSDTDYAVSAKFDHIYLGDVTDTKRALIVENEVRSRGIDIIVHHDAYDLGLLTADLRGARTGGAKTVVFWHSVFTHFLLRPDRQREAKAFWDVCRLADAMITLTRADETFFRMYGIASLAIPYSDPDIMEGFVRKGHPKRIVWMGRFVELKRPLDAIEIFENVAERHPDAELDMLGDGELAGEIREYLAACPNLTGSVRLAGFRNDVRPYLEKAGVGLVTSRFEGYGHSIVEMKMASLPVVGYDMPWLDTLRPGSGVLTVPQGDIAAAAEAIVYLFDNQEICRRQGETARESYRKIVSIDQESVYSDFFDRVLRGDFSTLAVPEAGCLKIVAETLAAHVDDALRLCGVRTAELCADAWRADRSYRLGRLLSWPYRFVRHALGGACK